MKFQLKNLLNSVQRQPASYKKIYKKSMLPWAQWTFDYSHLQRKSIHKNIKYLQQAINRLQQIDHEWQLRDTRQQHNTHKHL